MATLVLGKSAPLVKRSTKEKPLMNHEYDEIASPRPLFKEKEVAKKTKRLMMGGKSAGVTIDVSEDGIEFNGYYQSLSSDTKFACVREPVEITWDEFEKIRKSVFEEKPKKRKRKKKEEEVVPDKIDVPDQQYLDTLPLVTLNHARYYIDAERRERRSAINPDKVFNF